jgi:hypothetical protein
VKIGETFGVTDIKAIASSYDSGIGVSRSGKKKLCWAQSLSAGILKLGFKTA